jgi:2-keto-3-deoxy-L-rhamnonate aldolase RhmA
MAYDDGAVGVVVPYVETCEKVAELVGASKFRPLKGGRLEKALGGEQLEGDLKGYIERRVAGNTLIINVESEPAMLELDRLLDIDGLDGVLIGPHDLSTSLGVPEQYDSPKFLKAVESILSKARSKGVGAGIHAWGSLDSQFQFIEMGANMLIHKADLIFVREALEREIGMLRQRIGGEEKMGDSDLSL